ncbi:transglutaminase TgpA family protein [Gottfriedia luciferensis]|uniref:transglutaminase TgpA family protein n=1 Tax=Gottfriedia luciferensis TaxID=178774 RepID=UPI000B44E9E3|nr:transglutaminaseTgpA domain-containing protein [Gottfriedia luciferensis]
MKKSNFTLFLLYTYSCILLLEWVRPIGHLNTIDHMKVFMFYMLIVFTLAFFKAKRVLQWLINIFLVLVFINRFYYELGFFHIKWLFIFIKHIVENMIWLLTGHLNELTNDFKTFLFLLSLSVFVYLINYFLNRNWLFFLLLLTVLFLSLLDSFTDYSAKYAIVRTVIFSFIAMSLLTFDNLLEKGRVNYYSEYVKKWMIPLVSMIILFVLIGSFAPKPSPIWTFENWPFQGSKHVNNSGSGGGTKTVGFDTDDSRLGGPIKNNDDPVFQYEANQSTYWIMETKDTYTGHGWVASGSTQLPLKKEDFVMLNTYPDAIETKIETARIKIDDNYQYNYIMYPQGIHKIINILHYKSALNAFKVDTTINRISYFNKGSIPEIPTSFEVEYELPRYDAKDLRKTEKPDSNRIDGDFYQKYTQLPANLPERIVKLAQQITKGKTNWYDKAKAIENYFDKEDYIYSQKNVAFPGQNVDYVDQFLFETKTGYCNNFSTSMAVMLRTLGIPTRWVKGFNGGDFVNNSKGDSSKQIYEVTVNNAHSWVEVFLPNQGWVSFEPTKGFSNELTINNRSEKSSTTANSQTTKQQDLPINGIKNKQKPDLEVTSKETKKTEKTNYFASIWNKIKLAIRSVWVKIFLYLGFALTLISIIYLYRRKWLPYYFILIYRFSKKENKLESAYLTLLSQLARYGLKRNENDTLRNYAKYIDSIFTTNEMTELTKYYEQYLYKQDSQQEHWEKCLKLWENLMKRTI